MQWTLKRTNVKLPLNTPFTAFAIVGLGLVVVRHDLDESSRQRAVLRLPYTQIGIPGSRRLLVVLDGILDQLQLTAYLNEQICGPPREV